SQANYTATDVNKWLMWPQPGALALGAGVTIGTSDDGYTASAAVTFVLMMPGPVIQFIGKANILSKRVSGRTADATFNALATLDLGADTFELAVDARYSMLKVIRIEGTAKLFIIDAGSSPAQWYFALGLPSREKRIRARLLDFIEANAYFVASEQG